jgi:AbrB family looped-hinge helix DNA binding protein
MSAKGQIVVPKKIRQGRGFKKGSTFAFFESKQGDLVFRPLNPKLVLIDHLVKFKGLQIPKRNHYCPPPSRHRKLIM